MVRTLVVWMILIHLIIVPNHGRMVESSSEQQRVMSIDQIGSSVIPIGDKVLFQPFYWDMADRGTHWKMLLDQIDMIAADGFGSMWLPPPSKTREGYPATGGYEPYDFYDLGVYDQKGRVRTLFGTQQELIDLIAAANTRNIGVIADIVINHRMGGEDEYNPYTNSMTPTNFMNVASGMLRMNYTHFWPNTYGESDAGRYGNFPDISHANPEVRDMFIEWAMWLRDTIGYDGFRFDSAQGIDGDMIRSWMNAVRQDGSDVFGVSEFWLRDPTPGPVLEYLQTTNDTTRAMDFALLEVMKTMLNDDGSYDMRDFVGAGISGVEPDKAVTFTVNHDTYRDKFNVVEERRHLGYAYILTHPGYPSVFFMDYLDLNLRNHIRHLVDIHNRHAFGQLSVLYVDEDIYVAQREGEEGMEGLLMAMNDQWEDEKTVTITTQWPDTTLYNLINSSVTYNTDNLGSVTIEVPASSYIILSPDDTLVTDLDLRLPQIIPSYPHSVDYADIILDGELDYNWGVPIAIDGENSLQPTDLTNLYVKQDNQYLFIGFGYENLYNWTQGSVDYEIALDTGAGGSNDHPFKSLIKFGGLATIPDYLYHLSTDFSPDNNYARVINEISAYEFDEEWQQLSTSIDVVSHAMLGFMEVAIPLAELNLQNGGEVSVKIISSLSGSNNPKDSIPSDINIFTDQESWLFLKNRMIVAPSGSHTTTNTTTPLQSDSETTPILPTSLMILTIISVIKKRRSINL